MGHGQTAILPSSNSSSFIRHFANKSSVRDRVARSLISELFLVVVLKLLQSVWELLRGLLDGRITYVFHEQ